MITRLLPLTDYISGTGNETLRALLGHTNRNIERRSSSAVAVMTMVAAANIVRFPPVMVLTRAFSRFSSFLEAQRQQLQMEQLERLRSDNTSRHPMITHAIDSYCIPSQNMTKLKLQI